MTTSSGRTTILRGMLTLREAFWLPLQSPAARRDIFIGGLWLLVPGVGWVLNMGHRIAITHAMLHDQPPWPAWRRYPMLFKHGCVTLAGMIMYYLPAFLLGLIAWSNQSWLITILAVVLGLLATAAIPGYMTHYSHTLRSSEVFNPVKAMRHVIVAGSDYWRAWFVAIVALVSSFAGLLFFGVGFLWTSVWFWQVAAAGFASAMATRHALGMRRAELVDKHAAPATPQQGARK